MLASLAESWSRDMVRVGVRVRVRVMETIRDRVGVMVRVKDMVRVGVSVKVRGWRLIKKNGKRLWLG